jgi:transposase
LRRSSSTHGRLDNRNFYADESGEGVGHCAPPESFIRARPFARFRDSGPKEARNQRGFRRKGDYKDESRLFLADRGAVRRLAALLPTDTRGKRRVDDRRVISGIVHVLKSVGRWVDAPDAYGPRKTLYNRFVRWAAKGIWVDIFHALVSAGGTPAEVLIDSSAVKAHRCASGGKGGNKIRRSADRVVGEPRKSTP